MAVEMNLTSTMPQPSLLYSACSGTVSGANTFASAFPSSDPLSSTDKDKDFYQRSAIVGQPPKVIHLTLGNCSVADI